MSVDDAADVGAAAAAAAAGREGERRRPCSCRRDPSSDLSWQWT